MPFVSEVSETISVEKTYTWTSSSGNQNVSYGKAVLKVTTNNDKVSYEITMTTKFNDVYCNQGNSKAAIGLYLSIGNTVIYNKYFKYSSSSSSWNSFPTLNGSKATGEVTVPAASTSIPVVLKISPSSDPISVPSRWKTSETTLTRTYYTTGSAPTISVSDLGRNMFNITVQAGKPGDYNTRISSIIYYTTDGSDPRSSTSRSSIDDIHTDDEYTQNFNIAKDCTIKAVAYSEFQYGPDTSSGVAEQDILFYAKPIIKTSPYISYTKSRLTLKEPWEIIFNAEAGNSRSSIVSYWVRVFVNGAGKLVIPKTETTTINNNGIIWKANTQTLTIDPIARDFKVGDKVKIYLTVNAKMGDYSDNGGHVTEAKAESIDYEVRNAGIVRIKEGGSWREGQVYVKVDGNWKEADTVYTKVGGSWKESQ